jgi:Homing endonuclease associated repeat
VATAQRLEGVMSAVEIAELLGVHPRTVRSYWRATSCRRCGGPQINPSARSCADCIPYVAYRRRTRDDVVQALRRWAAQTGAPPRSQDWSEPGGKWEHEYPTWPSTADVLAHFGDWPQALAAVGLRPHRRTWTRRAIVTALEAWDAEHGRPPMETDWTRAGHEHPPASTVGNVFGCWSAALRAAGFEPRTREPWSEREILDGLRAFVRDHGRPPTSGDLRQIAGTPYPPAAVVIRTIGSLRSALERLGHQAAWTPVADDDILAALRAWAAEHGSTPTCPEWRRSGRRPGASTIIRRYGAWNAAIQAATTK